VKITRREFMILTTAFAAGCSSAGRTAGPPSSNGRLINAGPASKYAGDGVYGAFRERGFFLVRQGEKLFAISSICTHRRCKLNVESNRSFYCPCHGSTFDPVGHVVTGPARRDLTVFDTAVNAEGQLIVSLPGT